MPYLRANWEGLNDRNGGGKFALNQVHSVDGVRLQRASRGGPRTCFVHGKDFCQSCIDTGIRGSSGHIG